MSTQIDTALKKTYESNIYQLVQQMGSRLRDRVIVRPVSGEKHKMDRVGATDATKITARHSDTVYANTPHDGRWIIPFPWDWADLIDRADKLRALADPTAIYTKNAVDALGRAMDDELIAAAVGTAYSGKEGTIATTFPAGQQIAVDFVESGAAANSNLTIAKLRQARFILDDAEAVADGEDMTAVVTAKQIQSLLQTTEVTSKDYNIVAALYEGKIDTFMGFKFIRTKRLTKSGNNRTCLFFARSGLILGLADEITVEVDRLPTKRYSTQVYVSMDIGAVREQEEKVVSVLCDETA